MRTLVIIIMAVLFLFTIASAQDTTRVPIIQDDPALKQSAEELQQNMLQDMIKIGSAQLPEGIKKAVEANAYKGSKVFYKHKKKDEYAVEVRDGEVSSYHFFDKEGNSLNKRD